MSDQHLVLSISSHGLGHLSQVSAALSELDRVYKSCKYTVRSSLSKEILSGWIPVNFDYWPAADDVCMKMHSALDVDSISSEQAYREFHLGWDLKVEALSDMFRDRGVTHVLCGIPYLPLAAAQRAGLPNIAMCSLNWADIMEAYLKADESNVWITQARDAYLDADFFIKPSPSMAMDWVNNAIDIPPIGRTGFNRRKEVLETIEGMMPLDSFGSHYPYLVLVGMGGLDFPLDISQWPASFQGQVIVYLVPDSVRGDSGLCPTGAVGGGNWEDGRSGSFDALLVSEILGKSGASKVYSGSGALPLRVGIKSLSENYQNLVASVDLMITKPGYGTFVEAAAVGVPLLWVERPDWPDVPGLFHWFQANGHGRSISRQSLSDRSIATDIHLMLARGRSKPVVLNGNEVAAQMIAGWLDQSIP